MSVDENILQAAGGPESESDDESPGAFAGARVAATNVFVRDGEEWRMVMHHGSPVGVTEDDG